MDSPREIRDGEEFALETLKTYLLENNINACLLYTSDAADDC